jgi:hypothetical protein
MAGENLSGLIFGKIVGSDERPLSDVQVSISFVTCDVETNNGMLTIAPMRGNKLRGVTNSGGIFCVGFEFSPTDVSKVMSRVYDARLSAIKWGANAQQERPAVRFSARCALALDVKNWFISGIGAPQWNSPASDLGSQSAQMWGTYRSAVNGKGASFPNVPTLSPEHFGIVGDAGVVVMPPV